MNPFNKYGAANEALCNLCRKIDGEVEQFILQTTKDPTIMRAIAHFVETSIGGKISEMVLRHGVTLRKNERDTPKV